jgi:hypothetical protein
VHRGSLWLLLVSAVPGCTSRVPPAAEPVPGGPQRDIAKAGSDAGTAGIESAGAARPFRFHQAAAARGLQFDYYNAARGRTHIRETMGGGAAFFDLDGDGFQDLYFTDGCDMPLEPADRAHRGRLFRNLHGRFCDVTDPAGLRDFGYGQGCAAGDCDNDGFDDLVVTHYGSLAVYSNQGDGTVRDSTDESGTSSPLWNTAAALADVTGDGQIDLFVTGYLEVGPSGEPICRDRRGKPAYCGPEHFPGQSFRLFLNQGDGQFRDVSSESGVVLPRSKGLAACILDVDEDSRPDIFVVNDAEPARLFHNDGAGRFHDTALVTGLAFNSAGQVYNGMGIAPGDYDGDGRIDFAVSNFYEKGIVLFRNLGRGLFRDESGPARLGPATRPFTSFGLQFIDADNDGWLDLFVANGHISDLRADGIPYAMTPQVFRNLGDGRFADVSARSGEYFQSEQLGRGVAAGDLDRDGRCDMAVSHNTGPAALLLNETAARGHYLAVELVGTRSSRTPFGAKLTARLADRTLVRILPGGGSYLSASDRSMAFGLGAQTGVVELEVLWPSGQRQVWGPVAGDRVLRLIERP